MSDLYWLSDAQMERLRPTFLTPWATPCGRQARPQRHYLHQSQWLAMAGRPREYGPHKTLYNNWIRWSRTDVFARIMGSPPSRPIAGRS